MKILVVGSGGREHAIAWRLAQDEERHEIFCAPGNAGTAAVATSIAVGAEDVAGVAKWARENGPDLVVVGPEAPLVKGLADELLSIGVPVFGPVAAGARMEGSKRFAKEVMDAAGVPTGRAETFTDAASAKAALARATDSRSSSRPTDLQRGRAWSSPRRASRRSPRSTTCSSGTSSGRQAPRS